MKILLVEDDTNLGQLLKEYLEVKGFETTLCRDGEEGLKSYQQENYDFCIFDVMLPKMDGFTLAEKIRVQENDQQIPIIFLTAKSLKEDTIHGLKIGADDYMTKPFRMEELLLRIQAIMKRTQKSLAFDDKEEFEIGHFVFNSTTQFLTSVEGKQYKLTSKESQLFKMLCQHKNQVVERSKALKEIWHEDTYFNARSMDVYITKLRKYLKSDEKLQIINVHGQGFKLVELNN